MDPVKDFHKFFLACEPGTSFRQAFRRCVEAWKGKSHKCVHTVDEICVRPVFSFFEFIWLNETMKTISSLFVS